MIELIESRARNGVAAYINAHQEPHGTVTPDDLVILFSQVTDTKYWALLQHPENTAVWSFQLNLAADYWTIEHFRYVGQIDSRMGWEE